MIEARGVTYRYPSDTHPAVQDVSVSVSGGEVVGIVGPNGSGKSTVGRLLKGLLLPDTGSVTVDGLDTAEAGWEVRRLVGLLFQNPNSQIVNSVVENEVAFGPENLGLPHAEIRARVDSALEAVGLEDRAADGCHKLSMADKQRVALAAVMALHPRYLILDEPTAWIEPAARWPLLDEMLRWAREREVGTVLITHRMDEALVCSRLYGMLHGRLEVSGPPLDLLDDGAVRDRLGLEVPDAYQVARVLQAAGLPVVPGEPVPRLVRDLVGE